MEVRWPRRDAASARRVLLHEVHELVDRHVAAAINVDRPPQTSQLIQCYFLLVSENQHRGPFSE